MLKLRIEVIGATAWNGAFIGVTKHIEDMTNVWATIQNSMFTIFGEQFKTEGAAGKSGKWKKLSSPYAEIKAERWGDQPILQASGRMMKSLTGHTEDTVAKFEPQEATFGTSVEYAEYHQTGTPRMPARRIVDLSPEQSRFLHKEIQKELIKEMKRDPLIEPTVNIDASAID
jgi:phage gpG-like protein